MGKFDENGTDTMKFEIGKKYYSESHSAYIWECVALFQGDPILVTKSTSIHRNISNIVYKSEAHLWKEFVEPLQYSAWHAVFKRADGTLFLGSSPFETKGKIEEAYPLDCENNMEYGYEVIGHVLVEWESQ